MTDNPVVHIGQFRKVAVLAWYYLDEPHAEGIDLVNLANGGTMAVVVWMIASDECMCGNCLPTPLATCPNLARVVRAQIRRMRELYADRELHLDRFEVPAYLTLGGRLHEVVRQIADRDKPSGNDVT